MTPPRFPIEAIRHMYVTPFGGRSSDLYPGEVGMSLKALEMNTRLVPWQDQVLVSSQMGGQSRPMFAREVFRIVPLDDERPDALAASPNGEAVFSTFDDPLYAGPSVLNALRPGDPVTINATLSRTGAEGAMAALIQRVLDRQRGRA